MREEYKIPQIATGDLLRSAMREGTPLGLEAKEFMDSGELVPDGLVIALLLKRIEEADCASGFILDGFPRTLPQAEILEKELSGKIEIDAVVNFDIELTELVGRLTGRRVCPNGHGEWHLRFNPPKIAGRCDDCGELLIQRADDKENKIRTRLEVYRHETEPLIGFYEKRGLLKSVNALGDIAEIAKQIEEIFQAAQ